MARKTRWSGILELIRVLGHFAGLFFPFRTVLNINGEFNR